MDNEKLTLTEEQAENFVKEQAQVGDRSAYEYLFNIVKYGLNIKDSDIEETIYDLFKSLFALNTMVANGETFNGVFSKHYEEIHELYMTMQNEVQNCFTNDFDKYYEKYW